MANQNTTQAKKRNGEKGTQFRCKDTRKKGRTSNEKGGLPIIDLFDLPIIYRWEKEISGHALNLSAAANHFACHALLPARALCLVDLIPSANRCVASLSRFSSIRTGNSFPPSCSLTAQSKEDITLSSTYSYLPRLLSSTPHFFQEPSLSLPTQNLSRPDNYPLLLPCVHENLTTKSITTIASLPTVIHIHSTSFLETQDSSSEHSKKMSSSRHSSSRHSSSSAGESTAWQDKLEGM